MKNRRSILALVAALVVFPAGCASRFKTDADAPTYAAKAKIAVKTNRDDLREVRITVDHLAPPHRIDSSYSHYAVFFRVPGEPLQKAGVLKYNAPRRRGTLKATTPSSNFEVIISLESNGGVSTPTSDQIIVRQLVGDNGLVARWSS